MDVVLDDDLYRTYHNFKHHGKDGKFEVDRISKILRFAGNNILTNLRQWTDLGYDPSCQLAINLKHKRNQRDLSEVELARHSRYKIVLTDDPLKKDYPYVNIDSDEIEPAIGGFVLRDKPRTKAKKHLAALAREAKEVILYDKYFSNNARDNIDRLKEILPDNREITIYFHRTPQEIHLDQGCLDIIAKERPKWKLEDRVLDAHHDRYLIINGSTEIILTCGFEHLSATSKEFSYIVHRYQGRFTI